MSLSVTRDSPPNLPMLPHVIEVARRKALHALSPGTNSRLPAEPSFFALQQRQTRRPAGCDGRWGIPCGSVRGRRRRAAGRRAWRSACGSSCRVHPPWPRASGGRCAAAPPARTCARSHRARSPRRAPARSAPAVRSRRDRTGGAARACRWRRSAPFRLRTAASMRERRIAAPPRRR